MTATTRNEIKTLGFFSISFVRGSLLMIPALLIGMGLVSGVRLLMGLPAWNPNAAWTLGALFGTIAFLYGAGTLSDWLKLANGEDIAEHPQAPKYKGIARYFSISFDHKVIGVQYAFTSLVLFLIAGSFALIFRTELAFPGLQFLKENATIVGMNGLNFYNTIMSLHGIVMIGATLLGVGAMSNYLVPLMIGANDMAFPRLNAFAFWLNVPAAIWLVSTLFLGGFDTGWTGYPPLSQLAPLGMQLFFLGVYFIGLSSILGSLSGRHLPRRSSAYQPPS